MGAPFAFPLCLNAIRMKDDTAAAIRIDDVTKRFGDKTVLEHISLDVAEGEIVALVGPSGSGKSTLLRMVAGLIQPDEGEIDIGERRIGMVFQYSALFDSLTVFDNVAFALREMPDGESPPGGRDRRRDRKRRPPTEDEIAKRVHENLAILGLEGTEEAYPHELSGGMQKRVSFARAVIARPEIILYDEPTAGLDPIASTILEDAIVNLRDKLGMTSIVVTHQQSTYMRTPDRVCLLGEGKVHWVGTPKETETTREPLAREFFHASEAPPPEH